MLVNDGHTKEVLIQRGVKQGSPLFPMLFVIAMEPWAEEIRNNIRVQGYRVGKEEIKLNLYANDILLLL